MKQSDDLLTLQEAASMLGLHPETLRRWDRTGKLNAIKVNDRGDRRYLRSDVLKFFNGYKESAIFTYKEYSVHPYSFGFELFPDRFGMIAKYLVKKQDLVAGFAFAVPGLDLFAMPHITEKDLEDKAYKIIKERLDQGNVTNLGEYTYEFYSSDFLEIENPEWWNKK